MTWTATWLTRTVPPDAIAQRLYKNRVDVVLEARCFKRGCGVLGWWVPDPPLQARDRSRGLFAPTAEQEAELEEQRRSRGFILVPGMVRDAGRGRWHLSKGGRARQRANDWEHVWTYWPPPAPGESWQVVPAKGTRTVVPIQVVCPRCREVQIVEAPARRIADERSGVTG